MQESTTREKILKKIRNALIHKTKSPFPLVDNDSILYASNIDSPEMLFANQWIRNGGHFIFCESKYDFAEQLVTLSEEKKWKNLLCPDKELNDFLADCQVPFGLKPSETKDIDSVLTTCECLVARTGSILISSKQSNGRKLPVIANNHIIVAYMDEFVYDIKDALNLIKARYNNVLPSLLTLVSGPSKTADIELVQVTGAHGPAAVFIFLIEQENLE